MQRYMHQINTCKEELEYRNEERICRENPCRPQGHIKDEALA